MTITNLAILAVAGIGHLALTFLVVNVTHGSGIVSPWLNRVTLVFLTLSLVLLGAAFCFLSDIPLSRWPAGTQAYVTLCLIVAVIAIPADLIRRTLRGKPAVITESSEIIDLSAVGPDGRAPIGLGLGSLLLRLPGNESLRVRFHEYTVSLENLDHRLDGLSVLHVSDAHFTRAFHPSFFERAFDEAARFEPDLVVFTGDLVDEDACISWIEPVFRRLHGRVGSYAILGNHDHLASHERIVAALERSGHEILEGRWTQVETRGAKLTLGGTSAPWGHDPDPRDRPRSDLSLLLCHTPDRLYRVASWGIDLMFSGHNHGGQVRLPLIGPILMPSRFSRRFDEGFFKEGGTLLYVSRGLGAEHPIRYGCLPEIAYLTFRLPEQAQGAREREARDPLSAGGARAGCDSR